METNANETGYNGWTNYETWAVALWIDNEKSLQEQAHGMARTNRENALESSKATGGIWTIEQAARFNLADTLKAWVEEDLLPDLGATLAADLMGAALCEVDWNEIADNLLTAVAG